MNDLLRPSHYNAYHRIEAVRAASSGRSRVDVVGPVCESGDFLALDRELDDVAPATCSRCTPRARTATRWRRTTTRGRAPAEVLVDGDRFAVVTERETYEDLVRRERSSPNGGVD